MLFTIEVADTVGTHVGGVHRGVLRTLGVQLVIAVGLGVVAEASPAGFTPCPRAALKVDRIVRVHNLLGTRHVGVVGHDRHHRTATAQTLCIVTGFFFRHAEVNQTRDDATGYRTGSRAEAGHGRSRERTRRQHRTNARNERDAETGERADNRAKSGAFTSADIVAIVVDVAGVLVIGVVGDHADVVAVETGIDQRFNNAAGSRKIVVQGNDCLAHDVSPLTIGFPALTLREAGWYPRGHPRPHQSGQCSHARGAGGPAVARGLPSAFA